MKKKKKSSSFCKLIPLRDRAGPPWPDPYPPVPPFTKKSPFSLPVTRECGDA